MYTLLTSIIRSSILINMMYILILYFTSLYFQILYYSSYDNNGTSLLYLFLLDLTLLFSYNLISLIYFQILENLGPRGDSHRDLDDVQLLLEEGGGDENRDYGRLLEVTISYTLDSSLPGMSAGYVFRQPHGDPDADMGMRESGSERERREKWSGSVPSSSSSGSGGRSEYDKHRGNGERDNKNRDNNRDNNSNNNRDSSARTPACSVYSTGGGYGTLRDLDGVRCWLPCIDSPDQRAVYDVTLHYPSHMQALTCGKKISTSLSNTEKRERARQSVIQRKSRNGSNGMGIDIKKESSTPISTSNISTIINPLEHCFASHVPYLQPSHVQASHVHSKSDKSSLLLPLSLPQNLVEISTSRFFTVTRIPAMSVGFFVGQVRANIFHF